MDNGMCGPTEGNIQDPPLAVTANDQHIGHDIASRLYNDLPWLADPQEFFHLNAGCLDGGKEVVHLSLHQAIGPLLHVNAMPGGHFGGELCWHGRLLILIDSQDLQGKRCTLGQRCGRFPRGQRMGTVALPVLEGDG
jgi:hypothetical protein